MAQQDGVLPHVAGGKRAAGQLCKALRHDEAGLHDCPSAAKEVVVQGNPRVYKALRNQLDAVLMELQRIESTGQVEPEQMDQIEYMLKIMVGLNEKHDT